MEEAYPHDAYVSERTIDSHVKRLRAKFEEPTRRSRRSRPCTGSVTGMARTRG